MGTRLAGLLVLLASLACASPASATFPGANGKIIGFDSNGAGTVRSVDGTGRFALPKRLNDYSASADGTQLIAIQHPTRKHPGCGAVVLLDVNGGNRRKLYECTGVANSFSPGVREPRLSPDGRTALFVAYVDDESRLMLVDTDGSNPRPVGALGQPGAVALEPRFSADGTRIFVGSVGGSVILDRSDPSTEPPLDPVDTLDIFSVRLDGSDAVNLTNTPDRSEVMLDVAPDGSRIMFGEVGQHSGGVVLAKPDGSDPTEYAIPPALTPGYAYYSVSHVSFRPDGQGLAYALRYYCRSGPKKCPPSTLVNTGLDFSTPVAAGAGPVGFLSDWAPAATDVTSPATTLDQPRVVDGTPVTRAHSDDPGARFQCRLDQKPDEFCSGSPLSLPEVRPGRHQLCVKAVDPVGNVDATPACRGFKAPKD